MLLSRLPSQIPWSLNVLDPSISFIALATHDTLAGQQNADVSIYVCLCMCALRLTGYGIHHCFSRSMMDPEARLTAMCHTDYYTMAGIALATCLAVCPAVALMGRRGGLLTFMIITALASLLQLGLLNRE